MIDPITALSAASVCYSTLKKAVALGKDVEEIYRTLSKWAGHIEDVKEVISQEKSKPGIFKKLTYKRSATQEVKFIKMRRDIKKRREREVYNQMRRRKNFLYNTKMGIFIGSLSLILIYLCHFLWTAVMEASK